MLTPTPKDCTNCGSLYDILSDIDCTIYDLTRNIWNSLIYNIRTFQDEQLMKDLIRYKRVVRNRLTNPSYPSTEFTAQQIIGKVKLLAYYSDCSKCVDCFSPLTTTTTSQIP